MYFSVVPKFYHLIYNRIQRRVRSVKFPIKNTKNKEQSKYKTIYMTQGLISQVDKLAKENETSFNNIVVSMIEYCLKADDE